jgi:hypothetical protein
MNRHASIGTLGDCLLAAPLVGKAQQAGKVFGTGGKHKARSRQPVTECSSAGRQLGHQEPDIDHRALPNCLVGGQESRSELKARGRGVNARSMKRP